jgi:hypothetical protein
VLDDESKTLGEHGVEAGSQANAVSQSAAGIEECTTGCGGAVFNAKGSVS